MMLHLSRIHDYSTITSFHPSSSISESIEHFESNLESLRATVCSPKFSENLRVVWSTIGDTETTPK
ncbi:hypothetical protein IWQ62_004986 [Dispira parvispora]|uniref:Uncharacterized protein n=1 Tax=Dispira parvispora TaxID=1520584 RepID=A0A9W8AKV0_9FUNG|nr:hypothetical protein IWQ62_004986 [Dispira parvispora]